MWADFIRCLPVIAFFLSSEHLSAAVICVSYPELHKLSFVAIREMAQALSPTFARDEHDKLGNTISHGILGLLAK